MTNDTEPEKGKWKIVNEKLTFIPYPEYFHEFYTEGELKMICELLKKKLQ